MNDIVFADRLSAFLKRADGFYKQLKIFVPDGESDVLTFFGEARPEGDGVVVCIEQPLIPPPESLIFMGDVAGLRHAAMQAVRYFNGGGAVLEALGNLIISYLSDANARSGQPVVKALKDDIDKNFTDSSYSVETAIGKLPLNYDYVRKLFKKHVGVTPHEYLSGLRLKRAKDLILSGMSNRYSSFSVSQLAEACGFCEPLYFSRVFKKYYGVSPLNYIKENSR